MKALRRINDWVGRKLRLILIWIVDIIAEIGRAVLGRHLKQQTVILRFGPVEVPGNGVSGDRILETPAVSVAFNHNLDEGLVDHIHVLLAVAVGEIHLLAADNRRQVFQILRTGPVQGNIGERRLCAPAAGCIHAVDKALDTLLDFFLGQVVDPDKRSQIGIKAGKSLCAGPLVLHDAEEIHHLVAQRGQMAGR